MSGEDSSLDAGSEVVEIVASPRAADDRVLVLEAVGVEASVTRGSVGFEVRVRAADAERARVELARYRLENLPTPRRAPVPLHAGAFVAGGVWLAVLLLFQVTSGAAAFGRDWYAAGILTAATVHGGEPWRAITALTLHADLAHLASNAGFGFAFGTIVASLYGPGTGWLLVLVAATLANLANAALMGDARASLGASTAVFAALGAAAGHRWPEARSGARPWLRGANAVAALVLLALLGTGDERTDVLAHALGFGFGLLLALGLRDRLAAAPGQSPARRRTQHLAGALALALVVLAWAAALA